MSNDKEKLITLFVATVAVIIVISAVGLFNYFNKKQVDNCCVTITYYKEGCHLESCAKKHTFPCKAREDDIMNYNFTFNKPVKIIKLNYYHTGKEGKQKKE